VCELRKETKRSYYQYDIDEGVETDNSAKSKVDTGHAKDSLTLYDCLKLFSSEEQLGVNDAWYCAECQEFRQAYKKFDLWSAPQILVVQLKRFSQVNRIWRDRLDNLIDFPIDNLDLTEFVIGPKPVPPIYDLYAVSNHFGSMGGGHYTAFARHRSDNKWYRYDDSSVSETVPSEIVSRAAYVLFYRRKDVPWPAFDPSLDRVARAEDDKNSDEESDESDDDVQMKDVTGQAAGMGIQSAVSEAIGAYDNGAGVGAGPSASE